MYHKHTPEENISFEAFINMVFLVFFYNKGCIDELNLLYVFLISNTSRFSVHMLFISVRKVFSYSLYPLKMAIHGMSCVFLIGGM